MVEIIFKSILIGGLAGAGIGAGVARMFFAPKVQAAGAFRTLGEMNACLGDPVAHLSFGFSFYLNSAVQSLATGVLAQDFLHRVIPNVAAGILTLKNKKVEETVHDPFKMAIAGSIVGAVLYAIVNSSVSLVPENITATMTTIFTPAIANMMIIMQGLYLVAALENGVSTGCWGIVLGGVSAIITGNATPGLILGILTGKTIEKNGVKSKISIIFIVLMIVVWGLIAYFRDFYPTLIEAITNFTF